MIADWIIIAQAALQAALILAAASLVGLRAIPKALQPDHLAGRALLTLSAGITALSLLTWCVGSVLGTRVTLIAAGGAVLASVPVMPEWVRMWREALTRALASARNAPWMAAPIAVLAAWSAPMLALPIVDSDGLRYHLALPKLYLLEGHVFLYPWDVTGAYPQSAEMLYMIGLHLGVGETAKFLHFAAFVISVAALVLCVGLARSATPALVGAFLYGASPVALASASAAFIDSFVVLHIGVAVVGICRRWHAGAVGIALAGALWTKWTAAPAILGCCVFLLMATDRGRRWRVVVALAIPLVLVMTPIAARNLVVVHDPFFPVLTGVLTGGEVPGVDPELVELVTKRNAHVPGPLGIPWGVSVGGVGSDEVVGWHHLALLVLLPLTLKDRRARVALALVVPYLVLGLWIQPSMRLALPMLWGLGVIGGVLFGQPRLRRLGPVFIILALIGLRGLANPQMRVALEYLSGRVNRAEAQRILVPGWRAAQFVNESPVSGRVMALDFPAPYLFDRAWIAEGLVNLPPLDLWLAEVDDADQLVTKFRNENVRLLVVTPGYGGGRWEALLPLASTPREVAILIAFRDRLRSAWAADGVEVLIVPES